MHIRLSGSISTPQIQWNNNGPYLNAWNAELIWCEERLKLVNELNEFANWAFGPSGIASLQLIAFGDFFHKRCFEKSNALLCRSEDDRTYRRVEPWDIALWELIERNYDFLEACPMPHTMGAF